MTDERDVLLKAKGELEAAKAVLEKELKELKKEMKDLEAENKEEKDDLKERLNDAIQVRSEGERRGCAHGRARRGGRWKRRCGRREWIRTRWTRRC